MVTQNYEAGLGGQYVWVPLLLDLQALLRTTFAVDSKDFPKGMLPREFYGPYSTYGPDSLVHLYSQRFPPPGLQYENYCAGYKSGRKIELEKVRGQNCKIAKFVKD